ncbi:hypothetical protein CVT26_002998 [Gymnopilus dilepis]|uniref:Uncharacterized protein n=1 Tax=Gymnopilus dilepis TaxID=231916 RepID=A0A409Y4K6_9AGAR|nr:hypothetical protein CVT26_002998 [Gymnopilus dilepis]
MDAPPETRAPSPRTNPLPISPPRTYSSSTGALATSNASDPSYNTQIAEPRLRYTRSLQSLPPPSQFQEPAPVPVQQRSLFESPYSSASSRTRSTDYGIYARRMALSQPGSYNPSPMSSPPKVPQFVNGSESYSSPMYLGPYAYASQHPYPPPATQAQSGSYNPSPMPSPHYLPQFGSNNPLGPGIDSSPMLSPQYNYIPQFGSNNPYRYMSYDSESQLPDSPPVRQPQHGIYIPPTMSPKDEALLAQPFDAVYDSELSPPQAQAAITQMPSTMSVNRDTVTC